MLRHIELRGARGDKIDELSMGSLSWAPLLCEAWAVEHVEYNRVRLVIFDIPLPLALSKSVYCIARGPSRYVKYNGFGLVIFATPYVFSRFLNLWFNWGVLLTFGMRVGCGFCWVKEWVKEWVKWCHLGLVGGHAGSKVAPRIIGRRK
jgi:hypothetical protein